jgi:hypothetical protein
MLFQPWKNCFSLMSLDAQSKKIANRHELTINEGKAWKIQLLKSEDLFFIIKTADVTTIKNHVIRINRQTVNNCRWKSIIFISQALHRRKKSNISMLRIKNQSNFRLIERFRGFSASGSTNQHHE